MASSCYGDSGGPLVCINPDSTEPKLYGIVSWGYRCGTPSFYAKISSVIDWFDDVIEGRYPPDPCEGGVCQLPEGTYSPGNKWFSNEISGTTENDTGRKKRSLSRVHPIKHSKLKFMILEYNLYSLEFTGLTLFLILRWRYCS